MEENLKAGSVVEILMPTTQEILNAVVIEVSSYIDDYAPGNEIRYTLMLYAQNMLFYATYTYEENWYYDEDEYGNMKDYVKKECSPLTFKSIIATNVIMPDVDEQLKELRNEGASYTS